jgi:hypothetical protein
MQTALTVAGYAIGAAIGGPMGSAALGGAIGGMLGAYLGAQFLPDVTQRGPRMEDRRVQISSYGAPIPRVWGAVRLAGNVIWAADLEEVETETEVGGKGGPSQTVVNYSYYATFAVLLSFGQLLGIRKIWADAALIYDGTLESTGDQFDFVFYGGTEDQLPDPTMEAALGVGKVPAYRGYSYIVFNRFPLERFGNRIPSFTFEVVADTGTYSSNTTAKDTQSAFQYRAAKQRIDGKIIAIGHPTATTTRFVLFDPATGDQLLTVDHDIDANGSTSNTSICLVPPTNEIWIIDDANVMHRFSADTFAELGSTSLAFTGWNGIALTYDPVHRIILCNRAASQVGSQTYFSIDLRGVVQGDYSAGVFFVYNVTAGGSNIIIGIGSPDISALVTPPVSGGSSYLDGRTDSSNARVIWDAMRQHYVAVTSDNIWTISDTNPPVFTAYPITGDTPGIMVDVQYIPAFDAIAVWSTIVGIMELHLFDADTFELLHHANAFATYGAVSAFLSPIDPGTAFIIGNYRPYEVAIHSTTVGEAVADLCTVAGLAGGDINVSELTQRLRGYIVGQVMPARSAIEQLAIGYQFEGAEIDDQLYFKRRGGASVETILADDCGAGKDNADEFPIKSVRAQESELPRRLSITAPDPAMDHQPATQYAERLVSHAGGEEQIQLAIVMTVEEAAQLALALLFDRWVSRTRYTFATGHEYARLVPTDPITLDGRRARIMGRTHDGVLQRWEALADDQDVTSQSSLGVASDRPATTPSTAAYIVPSQMTMLDIAILRDADDVPGAYVAISGQAPFWRGAVLYASDNTGLTYTKELTMPSPGSHVGVTTNALGNWTGGNVFDETNFLNVSLASGEPASTTRLAALGEDIAMAVANGAEWEIVQYRDAVLESDGTYTLTGLLRGRRGTEHLMSGHAVGDAVVMLDFSSIRTLTIDSSKIGIPRLYKPASIGDTLAKTPSEDHTITAERLMPWSPVHLGGGRNVAGDLTLNWTRRTRVGGAWMDSVDASLGEDSESYEVDIHTDATRTTVARTIAVSSETAAYTAAQQTTDFGSPQSTVYWAVYQLSATVGRGHVALGVT